MIASLKPHTEYIDSGLSWTSHIPAHWSIKRAKSQLSVLDIRTKTGREELLSVSSARGVVPRTTTTVTMFKAKSYIGYKLCWPQDLVVNSLWAWGGGLGVSRYHGIISTAYSVYRVRPLAELTAPFLHQLVRSAPFQWELQVRSKGVWKSRLQLTDEAFLDAPVLIPPPSEQAAIVKYLNWATGRLDRAIRATKMIIALLNEQKQAIIRQAVMRGLDPNVRMKPSGIPWLGEIPEHWEVRRLKHLAMMQSGDGITSMEIEETGRYPVYGGNGLRGYTERFTHEGHYVLIGRQGALCGNIKYAKGKFYASEHAVVVTTGSDVDVEWFGELLRVMNLNQYSQSAAQPGLSVERIKNLWAPLPLKGEQESIIRQTNDRLQPLTHSIAALQSEIQLLVEYRTRLVSDVVTGKVDVREAAAKLPDELTTMDEESSDLIDDLADGLEEEIEA